MNPISSRDYVPTLFARDATLTIFDVGAHKGESALKFREMFKNADIYSFEPFPDAFKELSELKLDRFKPFGFGFSDRTAVETFSVNRGSPTNSLLELSPGAKDAWGGINGLEALDRIDCEFRTVDGFCKESKIRSIDFMKVDVQGAEYKVLKGAHRTLLDKKINFIQMEVIIANTYVGQKSMGYYIQLMEWYGYKIKMICDLAFANNELAQADLVFAAE